MQSLAGSGTKSRKAPILVLGSGRGGTSAVAGVVHILGFDIGSNSQPHNEDMPLQSNFRSPKTIAAAIARRQARGKAWAWKDVNFVHHLEKLMPIIPANTKFVVVTRAPEIVTESMMRYDNHPPGALQGVLEFSLDWQEAVRSFLKDHPEAFNIGDFDEFRKNPNDVIKQLADWLPGDKTQIERAKRYIALNDYVDPREVK